MSGTVVVLSGGLDSTVALWWALRHSEPEEKFTALTVDYGQRHVREIAAADAVGNWYRIKAGRDKMLGEPEHELDHVIIGAPGLGRALSGSALTDRSVAIPHGHYADANMAATIVPNRNMIIMSMAAGVAIARGASRIVIGVHAGDHPVYPDCRPEFIEATQKCIQVATGTNIHVCAPFTHTNKWQIVAIGNLLGAPMHLTWSCYEGGDKHCGRCGTCVERAEAFKKAEVDDPTEYESGN